MQVVTLDGPAGAGKSTVARRLAEQLGWRLLDTGSMYRTVALAAIRAGVPLEDGPLGHLVGTIAARFEVGRAWLDGEDVSDAIRTGEVTRLTRFAADSPQVRRHLVGWQRRFAVDHGPIVTEGRDQGTIVFPEAVCKFFVTATPEERARRRHAELAARGDSTPYETILRDVRERDAHDEARVIAPLIPAADALIVDTTGLDLDEVVRRLAARSHECLESASRPDPR